MDIINSNTKYYLPGGYVGEVDKRRDNHSNPPLAALKIKQKNPIDFAWHIYNLFSMTVECKYTMNMARNGSNTTK